MQRFTDTLTITTNGSAARSAGLEAHREYPATRRTLDRYWFAYNDAKLTETFPPGPAFGEDGDRLPLQQPVLRSRVDRAGFSGLSNGASAFFGVDFNYVDDRLGVFTSTAERQELPSYTRGPALARRTAR